jgi:Leucine-rich repeat (LRR) protein
LRRLDRLAERPECRGNVAAIKQWFGKTPPPLAREEMVRLRGWWKELPRHGAGWQPALKQALGVEGAEPSDQELSRLPTVGALKLGAAIRDAEPMGMLAGLRSLTFQGGFRQPTPPVTEAVWRALVAFPLRKLACGPVEGRLAGIEALAGLEYLKIADPDVPSFEFLRPLERLATLVIACKQPPATPFSLAPIGALKELRELVLTGCPVKDLAALGGCARLHVLRLDECHLDSLADLPRLPMLTKASFSENRIRSVAPLLEQPQLVELGLEGNPLKDAKLLKARRGLRVEL